jgi:hypothetical protein
MQSKLRYKLPQPPPCTQYTLLTRHHPIIDEIIIIKLAVINVVVVWVLVIVTRVNVSPSIDWPLSDGPLSAEAHAIIPDSAECR